MWKHIISITGNTAVGTTTLANRLSQLTKWKAAYSEPYIVHSPFFNKFLRDHKRWAFHNQAFFIAEYVEMYQGVTRQIEPTNEILCLDYTVFELMIYTNAMKQVGLLDHEEAEVLSRIFELLQPSLLIPDLLIYLTAKADVLIQRVNKRNRTDESNIDRAYIEALQSSFGYFIGSWDKGPILLVDSEKEDFLNDDNVITSIADEALKRIM